MKSHQNLVLISFVAVMSSACASTQLMVSRVSNDPSMAIIHLKRESAFAGAAVSDWVVDAGDAIDKEWRMASWIVTRRPPPTIQVGDVFVWELMIPGGAVELFLPGLFQEGTIVKTVQLVGKVSSGGILSWERNPGTSLIGIISGGNNGGMGHELVYYGADMELEAGKTYYILLGAAGMGSAEERSYEVSETPLFEVGN